MTLEQKPQEQQLLDVSIVIFKSDLDAIDDPDLHYLISRIRAAETRYMPVILKETLHYGEQWGEIRIVARPDQSVGVLVQGKIIESNGHTLQLSIRAQDASGKLWFERDYIEHVGDNVFGRDSLGVNDPFQGIYTRIANDLLQYREANLTAQSIKDINNLADIHFAARFAPEKFNRYLKTDENNQTQLLGLPAVDDPLLARVEQIRLRDELFHQVMQQYYANFVRQMGKNYYRWRYADYRERKQLVDQRRAAAGDILRGTLYLGLAVAVGDASNVWRKIASIGIAAEGAKTITQGLDGLNISTVVLDETAASFGDSMVTQVIELEDRTVSLSGSIEEQYQQWRELLEKIYAIETTVDPTLNFSSMPTDLSTDHEQ